jgi:outer membrane protein insertion porin family
MILAALAFTLSAGSVLGQQADTTASVEGNTTGMAATTAVTSAETDDAAAVAPKDSVDVNAPIADYSAPKRYYINKVEVSGIKYLNSEILAQSTGLQRGDSVYLPSSYISQAITRLWSQRYFSDVKAVATPVGDSLNITFVLAERPLVYRWKIEGTRKGEATELLENMKLKRGTELSDFVLANSRNAIQKFFVDKGFRNAAVEHKITTDTSARNGVQVTFVVDKGHKVRIGAITFDGNIAFKDRKLRAALKETHKKDWRFWHNSKLRDKEFDKDKDNLIDFYNSKGYRNATVVSDSVYAINFKRIGIDIRVDEGNKYYFRNISWVGNSKYPTEQLSLMLGIKSGDSYDKKMLYKRLGIGREDNPDDMSVSSLYQNNGYLFSQIEASETIVGADSIDLQVKIFEGRQATVNEIKISGNMTVNDEVIRREIGVMPGELYDRSMLMYTIRQLSQMNHFNPEALQPDIQPVSGEAVNIGWPLTEQASDQFEVSGGWGAGMFVFSIGVTLKNISLKNFFKGSEWRPFPRGQNQQLSVKAQSNGSYYKAFSLSFLEPWLGGRKPNSLSVSAYYSEETNAYYMYQSGNKHFRTLGIAAGIGHRLKRPDPYFTINYEANYQAYNLKDWDYFIIKNGTANIFSLKTTLGRSTVNQPIYPSSGSEFSLSVAATPPWSLWDGKDYASTSLSEQDRYRWVEYHKWNFRSKWFYPLSPNNKFVLMARAELGYLGYYTKNKKSPFEGFDLGGDGMGGYNLYGVETIGLRGYENSSLTPGGNRTGDYASVYDKFTVELHYPFIQQPSSTIYGLVFAEGGNAFSGWKSFNPFQLKRSLGFGVRLYLPMIGLIGVDWGYGFDAQVGESKKHGGQFHFTMGMQF